MIDICDVRHLIAFPLDTLFSLLTCVERDFMNHRNGRCWHVCSGLFVFPCCFLHSMLHITIASGIRLTCGVQICWDWDFYPLLSIYGVYSRDLIAIKKTSFSEIQLKVDYNEIIMEILLVSFRGTLFALAFMKILAKVCFKRIFAMKPLRSLYCMRFFITNAMIASTPIHFSPN